MLHIQSAARMAKDVFVLSLPNIILVIFQSALLIAEAFYLGLLGDGYVAMLALLTPIYMLMLMLASGAISTATSSVVARKLGARDPESAKTSGEQSVALSIVLGLSLYVVIVLSSPLLLTSYTEALGDVSGQTAFLYVAILFASTPAIFVYNAMSGIKRGAGEMVFPAAVSIGCAAAAVLAMPAAMFGFGQFGGFGVLGAAATLTIANYVGVVILGIRVFREDRNFTPDFRWIWRGTILRELLSVAVPSALLASLNMVAFATITSIFAGMGKAGAAAYGAIIRLEYTIMLFSYAIGIAVIREVGRRIGAGQMEDARRAAWGSAILIAAFASIPAVLLTIDARVWLAAFVDDPETVAVGSAYLRITAPTYVAFAFGLAWLFVAQAIGAMKSAFLITVSRVVMVVALAIGLQAFGISPVLAAAIAMATCFVLYAIAMAAAHQGYFNQRSREPASDSGALVEQKPS